ncbi:hypothetical protein ACWDWO_00575 [Actinopolymorpha singaporensis]|uniref:Uncharacterized protein n=1 Tax=Actinopolymorpha singaporensis TaxID=117157 RepID=A0A1H1LIU5_9ACTN|nr:hypothetical protein [Actinopolymorpha singaporensis]SDR74436.1 hypothetical protein SAMN04489717_0364 [Actinopolymorpha singaporensis]
MVSGRYAVHARYLLAFALLLPLAAVTDVVAAGHPGEPVMRQARTVAFGRPAEYAGAVWRLTTFAPSAPRHPLRIPTGWTAVYVALTVTPRDAAAGRRIQMCEFSAADGRGNTWHPAGVLVSDIRRQVEYSAIGCFRHTGRFLRRPVPARETQNVVTAFLVPKAAVRELALRVLVPDAAPAYLRLLPGTDVKRA